MADKQGGKSNGASKRMSNPQRKANRAKSWVSGETRKEKRIANNLELHKAKVANNGLGARELRRLAARYALSAKIFAQTNGQANL